MYSPGVAAPAAAGGGGGSCGAPPRLAVLVAIGSRGDVEPMCALGAALASLPGWESVLAVEARLAPVVAAHRLPVRLLGGDTCGAIFDPAALARLQAGNPGLSLVRELRLARPTRGEKQSANKQAAPLLTSAICRARLSGRRNARTWLRTWTAMCALLKVPPWSCAAR